MYLGTGVDKYSGIFVFLTVLLMCFFNFNLVAFSQNWPGFIFVEKHIKLVRCACASQHIIQLGFTNGFARIL